MLRLKRLLVPRRLVGAAALLLLLTNLVWVLSVTPKPLSQQPFPDPDEYADSARWMADNQGFITYVHGPVAQAPRYPVGYPLLLEPFAKVGTYPGNIQWGEKVMAAVYVLAMVGAAFVLGGSWAALLAGIVVLVSPFARESSDFVLSDTIVAALLVMMVPLTVRATRQGDRLAGALMGLASLIRLTSGIGLLAALCGTSRGGWRRVLVWSLPFLIGLGLLQWALYGNPFYNGYDYWGVGFSETFKSSFVFGASSREGPFIFTDLLNGQPVAALCGCSNVTGGATAGLSNFWFYPAVLSGGFWYFGPPLLGVFGLWWSLRRWREPIGRYVLVLVFGSLILFDFYEFQAARFMAGPASVLVVLGCVQLTELGARFAARFTRWRESPPRQHSRSSERLAEDR